MALKCTLICVEHNATFFILLSDIRSVFGWLHLLYKLSVSFPLYTLLCLVLLLLLLCSSLPSASPLPEPGSVKVNYLNYF